MKCPLHCLTLATSVMQIGDCGMRSRVGWIRRQNIQMVVQQAESRGKVLVSGFLDSKVCMCVVVVCVYHSSLKWPPWTSHFRKELINWYLMC